MVAKRSKKNNTADIARRSITTRIKSKSNLLMVEESEMRPRMAVEDTAKARIAPPRAGTLKKVAEETLAMEAPLDAVVAKKNRIGEAAAGATKADMAMEVVRIRKEAMEAVVVAVVGTMMRTKPLVLNDSTLTRITRVAVTETITSPSTEIPPRTLLASA